MQMFGVGSITFIVGAILAAGGWLWMMAVLVRYDLHKSWGFAAGLKRLASAEGRADRRTALRRGLVMGAGLVVLFLSVLIGDSQRNRPCRDACRAAGFETGLFRGSPHESVNGRAVGPYRCWCRQGSTWSDAPLEVEPGG